ncbi:KR domain [Musa troglodytarum]|nr:KR domain [Musa troglodytarum]
MCSHDGIELQFATNHIGHFLLTHLLLEKMKNTTCNFNVEGRIVNVSSEGLTLKAFVSTRLMINQGELFQIMMYYCYFAYGQSKLANILHAVELSRRLKEEGVNITANSLHPGIIVTNLFRHRGFVNAILGTAGKLVTKNVHQGAATTCYLALHPQVNRVTEKYFSNSNLATPSSRTADADLASKLWDLSMDMISSCL